jgi:hypothetical protein
MKEPNPQKKEEYRKDRAVEMERLTQPISAEIMTDIVRKGAGKNIKRTQDEVPNRKLKWTTPEIKEKIRETRKTERTYQRNPTTENLIAYKIEKARTWRSIKEERKTQCNDFTQIKTTKTTAQRKSDNIKRNNNRERNGSVFENKLHCKLPKQFQEDERSIRKE